MITVPITGLTIDQRRHAARVVERYRTAVLVPAAREGLIDHEEIGPMMTSARYGMAIRLLARSRRAADKAIREAAEDYSGGDV